ncbi:hypothetical protein GQ53DRAFT_668300 [Thozetella sp. PMI_491]|nr:hypothetical protein GQ53DRAFT_668300 [Thozetella sp. PMI_491]
MGVVNGVPYSTADPPHISSSQGFVLVANVTDLSKDFSPSVNHWKVNGVHIGAAQSTVVLDNSTDGRIFFQNGTAGTLGIGADGGRYPWGLYVLNFGSDSPGLENVKWVGLQVGMTQMGLVIRDDKDARPRLYTPDEGTFVVCNETRPTYGRPPFPVRFVKPKVIDGVAHQEIPDLCVPINLLPQCSKLDPVSSDAEYDHAYVQSVRCYDNATTAM